MGVLEFTPDNPTPTYCDLDHQELYSILSNGMVQKASLPYSRIVVIEDISRGIVELLGSLLHIDPLFLPLILDTTALLGIQPLQLH